MVTKDQERKALKKIRDIVDSLGDDSYIGATFEGIFEIAENNIDNDWSINPMDTIKHIEMDRDKVVEDYAEYRRIAEESIEHKRQEVEKEVQRHNDTLVKLSKMKDQRDEEARIRAEHEWEEANAKAELEKAKQEVMELKAKLYDLMVKEA